LIKVLSGWLRKLKLWVEGFAEKPGASWSLFGIAFAESSFFPIPPDVLLIALGVSKPRKAFLYALYCSLGSVLGGMFGYYLGLEFYDLIGGRIIDIYGLGAFAALAIAGFTPIPYKVFTIAAGAFRISFLTLLLASAISRPARFFLVSALFYWCGPTIKVYIDKYLEVLTVAFVVLLVLGFFVIRWIF